MKEISRELLLGCVFGYFIILLIVAYITSRNSSNESFFSGNKNSNWLLVSFGMIGTSLSGVTFVSVPGVVGNSVNGGWQYLQVVMGNFLGYLIIAYVLLPLYYKMNVTSIYTYLSNRFGLSAHKTGASFFLLSRTFGATVRLYLVVNVLQIFILDAMGIPFWATAMVILLMILLYTFEGGVKTIVYTDTLQTTGMLLGLIIAIVTILSTLNLGIGDAFNQMSAKNLNQVFNLDFKSKNFFLKSLIGGAFVCIVMTGLDQEMMQKNISVKRLKDSQKNIMTLASVLIVVNLLFLFLGGLLSLYASSKGLGIKGDDLFPHIALKEGFSKAFGIIFIIALISALFPSVDGAITALTSSYCLDIAQLPKKDYFNEKQKKRFRLTVHLVFVVIFLALVLLFKLINEKNIIDLLLKIASITYGPLLGLFAFGILSKRKIDAKSIALICLCSVGLVIMIDFLFNPTFYSKTFKLSDDFIAPFANLSKNLFGGYAIGLELLLINGFINFLGLYTISYANKKNN
jgi:Na+/proline symporter